MTTLFVADLHLDDRSRQTTELFLRFLEEEAGPADALYILGDLFEYWLGDDAPSGCAQEIAPVLKRISDQGTACYFQHGNRDFLLGESFARNAGLTILPEEFVTDLYGERVLLMHGDSLCTDDADYQKFRSQVRDPRWQQEFLAQAVEVRLQVARQARDASAEHKGEIGMAIMDVNQGEVNSRLAHHGVDRMIHGHTHRPAVHDLTVNGRAAQRFVVGDWHSRGSVLRVTPNGYELAVV